MKGRSLEDWIELYEEKTGDKAAWLDGYRLFYMAERGFATMKPDIEGKLMIVHMTCGDGKFWRDYAEMRGLELGLEAVGTICTRPILPYIRSFGWEILRDEEVDGKHRYWCQDSIGRKVICTYMCEGDEGQPPQYWVVSYFNAKAVAALDYTAYKESETECGQ